ncbi:MAG: hypothetical protein JJU40_13245, partial [Rhodobacteraceae bacterium]|nr:hypothetical protein [Paracoccaceae bacterium]
MLHAGLHKTGTTALQAHFAARRAELARAGITYPECGPGPGHHALAARWLRLPGAAGARWDREGAGALWAGLAGDAPGMSGDDGGIGARALLLSAEAFSRAAPLRVDMPALHAALSALGRPRLVLCLRGPLALAEALWSQAARDGPAPDPARLVDRACHQGVAAGVFLCPARALAHLRRGFAQ